jgi:hypothetical protein
MAALIKKNSAVSDDSARKLSIRQFKELPAFFYKILIAF